MKLPETLQATLLKAMALPAHPHVQKINQAVTKLNSRISNAISIALLTGAIIGSDQPPQIAPQATISLPTNQ